MGWEGLGCGLGMGLCTGMGGCELRGVVCKNGRMRNYCNCLSLFSIMCSMIKTEIEE